MTDYINSYLSANDKDSWATPDWLYLALNQEFNFHLDACASESNAKHLVFINQQRNALAMDNWKDAFLGCKELKSCTAWINPPYSRGMIDAFIKKAYEQCVNHKINSVLLVPATPDAGWWPDNATEIRFITGGIISFKHPITGKTINGNTKGSALIIFKHIDLGSWCVTRYVERDRLREVGDEILQMIDKQATE